MSILTIQAFKLGRKAILPFDNGLLNCWIVCKLWITVTSIICTRYFHYYVGSGTHMFPPLMIFIKLWKNRTFSQQSPRKQAFYTKLVSLFDRMDIPLANLCLSLRTNLLYYNDFCICAFAYWYHVWQNPSLWLCSLHQPDDTHAQDS